MSDAKSIQEAYDTSVCYGCGRSNEHGLHIESYWDGQYATAAFTPQPYHTSYPGYVYGGLLASLIDCHSIGAAVAAMYAAEGRAVGAGESIQCATANLNVSYRKPTPLDQTLHLRAWATEVTARKAIVQCELSADDGVCVTGEVVAVRVNPLQMDKP